MSNESTPLLPDKGVHKTPKNVVTRLLICAFLISLSFSFTQVSILYAFRLMTCDEYYKIHPPTSFEGDRCSINIIESRTARSISLLGMSTAIFGTLNLLLTTALIKRVGVHLVLIAQTFWPSVRLCCQIFAVTMGGGKGIWIFQITQMITVVGGPAGYLLVLNSYITEVVEPSERTGVFGRLQGCVMFGGAFGFLLGGVSGETFGILSPFEIALALMTLSTVYITLFLPYVKPAGNPERKESANKGLARLMGPTRMLLPQMWRLSDGHKQRQWGAPLLAFGVFLGVLATGYIPTLVQMYAQSTFGFGPTKNGYLMSGNSLIRGFFLSFAFPAIISAGREWYARRDNATQENAGNPEHHLLSAENLEVVAAPEFEQEPASPPKPVTGEEGSEFDLFFLRWSLVIDGILTFLATFTKYGWQVYLVAFILPLASGSASAAKSVMIEMCPISERADALSAITLVEMTAMVSTMSIFGGVFSGFAGVGKPHLTFACNAGVAVVAVVFLSFCHFAPPGSVRVSEEDLAEEDDVEDQQITIHRDGK